MRGVMTKELKDKAGRQMTYVERLDKLFRISPTQIKAKDGSGEILTVEHRVGRLAGAYTIEQLMAKLGFEERYAEFCATERRRYSDEKNWELVHSVFYDYLKKQLYMVLKRYREFLVEFYANSARPVVPLMTFVRLEDDRKGRFYIQAFRDAASYKPVLFDKADDLLLWAEKQANSTRRAHREYIAVQATVKATIALPGINKDIEHQMKLMLTEDLPRLK